MGVIPLDDLRDFWWVSCRMASLQLNNGAKYPRKVKPLSRVHACHRRQTDGFAIALAKRNVVMHVWLKLVIRPIVPTPITIGK